MTRRVRTRAQLVHHLTLASWLGASILAVGCDRPAAPPTILPPGPTPQATPQPLPPSVGRVEPTATRTEFVPPWSERSRVRQDLEQRLADLQARIEQLQVQAALSREAAARQRLEELTAQAEVQLDLLRAEVERLDGTPEQAWHTVATTLEHAFAGLAEALRNADAEVPGARR